MMEMILRMVTYGTFKYDQMIMQIKETMSIEVTEETKNRILNINCEDFNNIRELNAVLMNNIAKELYTDIVECGCQLFVQNW